VNESSRVTRAIDGLGLWAASVIFVASALPFAIAKPLTNDEIYTLRVAMQPSFSAIWSALASGADNHPPLDYWLRHASMGLFGTSPFALRLPSLVAVWLAMVCLYKVVARSLGAQYAFGATLLMLIVSGYESALATRGYALLLFSFGLSMMAWQAVATGHAGARERLMFVGGLVCAFYSHYYGVLHGLAFLLASLTAATRRVSFVRQPYLLIAAAAALSLPLWPLVEVAAKFSDRFWTPVTLTSALAFYPSLLAPAIPCLIAIALLAALVPAADDGPAATEPMELPRETVQALLWFSAMPVAMFVMASLRTGAFLPRYTVASGAALVILSVVLASRIRGRASYLGLIVAALPLAFMAVPIIRQVTGLRTHQFRVAFTAGLEGFQRVAHQPVIIGDDGVFVELSQSDAAQRLTNCYFLYDAFPDRPTNVDKAVRGLLQVWPIRAIPFDAMRTRASGFAFIGNWGDRVLERSLADGAKVHSQTDSSSGLKYWQVTF
jgi:4-amino-4-deoxy-L-arabinose transferase-like glycosyltransferase